MSGHKTLLTVDGNAPSRVMINAIALSKQPDGVILEAGPGQGALEVCNDNAVDFFTVELRMPNMDGLELIPQLRPKFPDVGIVFMTANIQDATHDKCRKLGIKCINKPVTKESIGKTLEIFGALA